VIDWELTGIGATLNDVGWVATFNTRAAWDETRGPLIPTGAFPDGDELVAMYEDAWGTSLPDVAWFRALAAYKFAIIAGFNLSLHRRGKRHDPLWETTALSIAPLLEHAADLLG
jgi:aminoglycoside phosphotransferase (APT) family kinase protein